MRRYIRSKVHGASYFFTVALEDRRSTCLVDHVALLRSCFARTMELHPFRIDAIVVLPEHLHAVWTLPPEDAHYALRWRLIKRAFTSGMKADLPRRGVDERVLWQRRFWEHQVRDEEDFARHVAYIHFNPVKHGLVTCAADWPHSSFHRYVARGWLPRDWGVAATEVGQYGE